MHDSSASWGYRPPPRVAAPPLAMMAGLEAYGTLCRLASTHLGRDTYAGRRLSRERDLLTPQSREL